MALLSAKDMDKRKASWILEFVLRQPVEDWIVNKLLSILPVSNDDFRLKKTILLRRISSEISKGLVSEKTLDSLEMIVELDRKDGSRILDSMKAAYRAVAVVSTIKFLEKTEIIDAVNRIWKGRIAMLMRSNCDRLISVELGKTMAEIERVIENPSAQEKISKQYSSETAISLVRAYIEEKYNDMGPSFLERESAKMTKNMGNKLTGLGQNLEKNDVEERPEINYESSVRERTDELETEYRLQVGKRRKVKRIDVRKGSLQPTKAALSAKDRRKGSLQPTNTVTTAKGALMEGENRTEKDMSTVPENGRESYDIQLDKGTIGNKLDILPSAVVNEVQDALRTSSSNLQMAVKDPLPNALDDAAKILATMEETIQQKLLYKNTNLVGLKTHSSSSDEIEDVQVPNTRSSTERNHEARPRPNFMIRNRTARTYEWDDESIEPQTGGSPTNPKEISLPSPKNLRVSPLLKKEPTKLSKRRKMKKWSALEEETLRTAVLKHGKGNWKFILNSNRDVFIERTEVDLKDKWRNMIRSL